MTDSISTVPPAPTQRQHGAKTLFWYFSLFWTMGATAFATGTVWFQVINKYLPKEVFFGGVGPAFSQGAIKGAVASLIVGAPAFFLFAWLIRRAIGHEEIELRKGARLWIGYLILFIVVAVALGDIITAVLTFLNGDFTLRFLLKSLIILLIASWIFIYFWLALRSADGLKSSSFPKIAAAVSAVVIIASLVAGFMLVEPPKTSRAKAFDQQRLNNLQTIKYAVESYHSRFQQLPEALANLNDYQNIPRDPRTDQPFVYEALGPAEYKLCATFETSNKEETAPDYYSGPYDISYLHDAGENCYSLIINPEAYPKEPVAVPIR